MKQTSFIPPFSSAFGSELLEGKRKSARPLCSQRPIHIVIRSQKARGKYSFANHRRRLDEQLQRCARKWGIKVYARVWVWDHLHAIIKIPNRTLYKNWIREFNAAIAKVLNATQLFELRPFTRVVEWGRSFRNNKDYLTLNELERFGLRPRKKSSSKVEPPPTPHAPQRPPRPKPAPPR